MEQTWIDRLARQVAATTTRRGLARLGLGGALAVMAGGTDGALGACKAPRKKCRKGRECCSRRCKNGKCAACPNGQTFVNGACTGATCSSANCPNGCCDLGVCVVPSDQFIDQFCGTNGEACVSCLADGQTCKNGACTTSCTPADCPGACCDGTRCRDGTSDDACGNGRACVACDADQDCDNGICTCKRSNCGAQGGCCNGDRCVTDGTDQFCGRGGLACVTCAAGQTCANGFCRCTAASCPAGCCFDDICRANSNLYCGTNGDVCVTCPDGQACTNGICKCTAASCPNGCCNGSTCEAISHQFCGTAGGACVTCGADQACVNGTCRCTAASCPSGCCDGDTCRAGTTDQRCGTAGGACVACAGGKVCSSGFCVTRLSGELTSGDPVEQNTCLGVIPTPFQRYYDVYHYTHAGGALTIDMRGAGCGGGTLAEPLLLVYSGTVDPHGSCDGLRGVRYDDLDGTSCARFPSAASAGPLTIVATTMGPRGTSGTYTLEIR